ncbi:MAG: hemin uptake protein HemP [Alphaproteobacteria bacterium]|jgi:hemin uptake protein HemP
MDQSPRSLEPSTVGNDSIKWDGPNLDVPVVDSVALMQGRRELVIRHNAQTYRLRVTASEKLILTK